MYLENNNNDDICIVSTEFSQLYNDNSMKYVKFIKLKNIKLNTEIKFNYLKYIRSDFKISIQSQNKNYILSNIWWAIKSVIDSEDYPYEVRQAF